jgi:malate dehydrogenase (oxaloacetate-decarboxylating)(NADP+)
MSTHSESYSVSSHERGVKLLETPAQNKCTVFTDAEHAAFGLEGLLPPSVETIDQQQRRILQQLGQKPTDLERYIFLLSDSNQTLYYHVVMSDRVYFLPILYDPTVSEACLKFGHIYRRPHGMYINAWLRAMFYTECTPKDINAWLRAMFYTECTPKDINAWLRAMFYKPEYKALIHQ